MRVESRLIGYPPIVTQPDRARSPSLHPCSPSLPFSPHSQHRLDRPKMDFSVTGAPKADLSVTGAHLVILSKARSKSRGRWNVTISTRGAARRRRRWSRALLRWRSRRGVRGAIGRGRTSSVGLLRCKVLTHHGTVSTILRVRIKLRVLLIVLNPLLHGRRIE